MVQAHNAFLTPSFLRSVWATAYSAYRDSSDESALYERLRNWADRPDLGETSAEGAFLETFFRDTWEYIGGGQGPSGEGFSMRQQFSVPGAGAKGGPGRADLALGYFTNDGLSVPQVLCEFKSIKSALDAEQQRKGNRRSPVQQCLDYLAGARRGMIGSEPILPRWGIVSNMNEFRLYWYDRGHQQYLRFLVSNQGQPQGNLFSDTTLVDNTEEARFNRFLFARLFHRDTLLTRGGKPTLLQLIEQRRFRDKRIETEFYERYKAFRDDLITLLLEHNGVGTPRFPGTNGRLVRMAQKILDRLLFVFYCEDMGQVLAFPPKLFQHFLSDRSNDPFFDPHATTIWQDLIRLFNAMDQGTTFGRQNIHKFNGGLFAPDAALDALRVPNSIFCQPNQAQNEAEIARAPRTVLYLCATYNYAADLGEGGERSALGLYTLGRIFEQSITELEIIEAQVEGRESVNKRSGRKTDGVYYTPEWVVERLVDGAIGPRLKEMRREAGWPEDGDPNLEAIERYRDAMRTFTVLDPACGSGAFLITALRYLEADWRAVAAMRRKFVAVAPGEEDMHDFLSTAIHGVDINPASVEIAQLSLWLHTARADRPLSLLGDNIRCGNSLVTHDFYQNVQIEAFGEAERERVNAFDWHEQFHVAAGRGGFDVVLGNPPYVKLQNFQPVHPDVAAWLANGRPGKPKPFESTQTGNFDLYLPFVEQGLRMLRQHGRLGYIAPSLWTLLDYGEGLRGFITRGQHLERWLDFRSYQVFEEATTYTALQFFTKAPTESIRVAEAPEGPTQIAPDPWAQAGRALRWGEQEYGDRWVLVTGDERALIDRLTRDCRPLSHPSVTTQIFVGVQTSADAIFHLRRLGPGRYLCRPPGSPRPPPFEVRLEDAIMRQLVSGADAKRYQEPESDTFVLFPYVADAAGRVALMSEATMRRDSPLAWTYLNRFKRELECREGRHEQNGSCVGPFADDGWYRFGRNQNINKQGRPKLVIPRLVERLGCSFDEAGRVCLDNVDVGGILVAPETDPWFLLGVLNASVADFVFRRVSKPFRGGYLSANRQFIKDLPVPGATPHQQAAISARAQDLQRLHTGRRRILRDLERRLSSPSRARPADWLFQDLQSAEEFALNTPEGLSRTERRARGRDRLAAEIARREDVVGAALRPGARLAAELRNGEMLLLADGVPAVDRVFVSASEAPFLHAQWQRIAATFAITERTTGKDFCDALRRVVLPSNLAMVEQVVVLAAELVATDHEITIAETDVQQLMFDLYGLSESEKALVLKG